MEELNNIDLNLCKSFIAVAKSGSISKAAEMLYVSQPAVSRNIKMLEDRLGCKLFNRTAKGVELTVDAEKLMYYVENAYNTIKTGFKVLNDSNDLLKGEVRSCNNRGNARSCEKGVGYWLFYQNVCYGQITIK